MFKQDETTSLPRKLTQKEKVTGQANQNSPTKRKAKAASKRTGGMRLQIDIPAGISKADTNIQQKPASSNSDNEDKSSISSEDIAPSPKSQNQKRTPPAIPTVPQRKSTRNRQSTLSTAFGNPVPINVINNENDAEKKTLPFEIDSPTDKQNTDNYPSLKSLSQEMCFTEKTPQFRACVKLIEAISRKTKASHTDVVDLTSPTEDDDTIDNNNDILFVKDTEMQKEGETEKTKTNNNLQVDEATGRKL